jgi:hypothetical protein
MSNYFILELSFQNYWVSGLCPSSEIINTKYCFLVLRIPDDGKKTVILNVLHHRQNPSDSNCLLSRHLRTYSILLKRTFLVRCSSFCSCNLYGSIFVFSLSSFIIPFPVLACNLFPFCSPLWTSGQSS